jgi:hypothetical protein
MSGYAILSPTPLYTLHMVWYVLYVLYQSGLVRFVPEWFILYEKSYLARGILPGSGNKIPLAR